VVGIGVVGIGVVGTGVVGEGVVGDGVDGGDDERVYKYIPPATIATTANITIGFILFLKIFKNN
jgi:hypothetical protein